MPSDAIYTIPGITILSGKDHDILVNRKGVHFPNKGLYGLADCVRDYISALEMHKKLHYPELGDFELGYDIRNRRLVLHTKEDNPSRERLEYALSYAISTLEEVEAKVGRDNL